MCFIYMYQKYKDMGIPSDDNRIETPMQEMIRERAQRRSGRLFVGLLILWGFVLPWIYLIGVDKIAAFLEGLAF